jgi:hypothetical protein
MSAPTNNPSSQGVGSRTAPEDEGAPDKGKAPQRAIPKPNQGQRIDAIESAISSLQESMAQLISLTTNQPRGSVAREETILQSTERGLTPGDGRSSANSNRNASDSPQIYSRPRKTELTEKIKALDDGTEPTFRQWKASIRDRLIINADHYDTEYSRKALVWGTTIGMAKGYIEERYLSDDHPFPTSDEMIKVLAYYFTTGNEAEVARNRFEDVKMNEKNHAGETFPEFKARFQSSAIKGQVSESEWFSYMWNKLTPAMRSGSAILKKQWKGDYYLMVEDLTFYDAERRRNAELNPSSFQKPESSRRTTIPSPTSKPTFQPRVGYSSVRPTPGAASPYVRKSDKPTTTQPERLRSAPPTGNCYQCGKPGHFKDQCPLNPSVKRIDGDDSETEEIFEESMETQEMEENVEA